MKGAGEPVTAEQVFMKMKRQYPSIVMATVYNTLNSLCAVGLIRRVNIEVQPDRYDRTVRHDHLICRCYEKLKDIFIADLTDRLKREIGFDIDSYDLRLSYAREACRKKDLCGHKGWNDAGSPSGPRRGIRPRCRRIRHSRLES